MSLAAASPNCAESNGHTVACSLPLNQERSSGQSAASMCGARTASASV
eukprot:CAMPEP_0182827304 /NCGR_PEP_ID=MMETSP0006_2-20121128/16853_1 /TAXON_ID=97485 /ORGANISM="Prymnesium parvum, Strain Texoma1" /LENGTH=47 /DNA_ID= /DNA_START= /DNA_END= /DNA_ORIENTATION=